MIAISNAAALVVSRRRIDGRLNKSTCTWTTNVQSLGWPEFFGCVERGLRNEWQQRREIANGNVG